MSKDRALAAEEAQVAKEELIESLEEALDTKRRLVATAEKVIEETRANLVSVQEQCNEEARAAKALQDELGAAHAKLAKAIETQHEGPAGREIETLRAQADSLAAQLREVNERAGESERRLRQHEALEKCASRDLMRSETDVQEQEKELFSLRVQFMGQAERLEAMHARCEAECERNEVLNARIRELNAKIFAARAGRGEGGEKPGPEEAEDGISSQDNKVKMLEARLLAEAREKAALAVPNRCIEEGCLGTEDSEAVREDRQRAQDEEDGQRRRFQPQERRRREQDVRRHEPGGADEGDGQEADCPRILQQEGQNGQDLPGGSRRQEDPRQATDRSGLGHRLHVRGRGRRHRRRARI